MPQTNRDTNQESVASIPDFRKTVRRVGHRSPYSVGRIALSEPLERRESERAESSLPIQRLTREVSGVAWVGIWHRTHQAATEINMGISSAHRPTPSGDSELIASGNSNAKKSPGPSPLSLSRNLSELIRKTAVSLRGWRRFL